MHRFPAILSIVLFLLGPLCAFAGIVPPLIGFGMYVLGAASGLIAIIWGAIAAIRAPRKPGLVSAALGVVPALAVIVPVVMSAGYPRINDISTDLDDPPALSRAADYPESFKPIVRQAYPELQPLRLPHSPERVYARALAIAETRDRWEVKRTDEDGMTFEGVATTALFRFRDDFVVRVRNSDDGVIVDMRSRSRDGQGDFGANAARIRDFLNTLRDELAASE